MMKQIHISKKELKQPIKIEIKNDVMYKPRGGFWTSTYNPHKKYKCDWIEWCVSEEPNWLEGKYYIIIPKKTAKIYHINSYRDLEKLFKKYHWNPPDLKLLYINLIDWKKVSNDFDALHMTKRGEIIARGNCTYFLQNNYSLYGWDCESTVWFRDVFEDVKVLKDENENLDIYD